MCETPSWKLELPPLPPTPYKYLNLWSDHRTKGMRPLRLSSICPQWQKKKSCKHRMPPNNWFVPNKAHITIFFFFFLLWLKSVVGFHLMVTLFLSITKRKHKLVLRVNFTNMKVSWSYKGKNGSPKNQLAIDLNLRGCLCILTKRKYEL